MTQLGVFFLMIFTTVLVVTAKINVIQLDPNESIEGPIELTVNQADNHNTRALAESECKCIGSECSCCGKLDVPLIPTAEACVHIGYVLENATIYAKIILNDDIVMHETISPSQVELCPPLLPPISDFCLRFKDTSFIENQLSTCLQFVFKNFIDDMEIPLGCVKIGPTGASTSDPNVSTTEANNNLAEDFQ